MPNEVYQHTREALATLVSERAATRVLDAALRRASLSADTLDASGVRKLLLGPVHRELEGILPRTGLRRTLRRLARQVADASPVVSATPTPVSAPAPRPSDDAGPLHPVTRSSVYLPDVEIREERLEALTSEPARSERSWPARKGATPAAVAVAGGEPGGSGHGEPWRAPGRTQPRGAAGRTEPTVVPQALPAEALDRLTVRFAEIEGVTQVIGMRDRNAPAQVRGEGIDPAALEPLARSAIRLLSRHGPVRSLVLEHAAGLLFVFPLGRDAVAVLTSTDVNMGAVFSARAALEEA